MYHKAAMAAMVPGADRTSRKEWASGSQIHGLPRVWALTAQPHPASVPYTVSQAGPCWAGVQSRSCGPHDCLGSCQLVLEGPASGS